MKRARTRTKQSVVPGRVLSSTVKDQDTTNRVVKDQDMGDCVGNSVSAVLLALVQDQDAPAAARVNAARTLAEMDGLIGRHQAEPERSAPSLATLSRDELVSELDRLRTAIDLGLVR